MPLGHRTDPRRHRGREQHGLARRRCCFEDQLDVLGEPHVEHLVGLVEHHGFDRVERESASADVVDGPTRRGDHDVDAARERLKLPTDGLAAVDRDDARTQVATVFVHGLGDLHRELAGGHKHECSGACAAFGSGEPLQEGERERRRLARACRSLAEQVATVEQWWDRLTLDRGRLFVAELAQHTEQFGPQSQLGEAHGPVVGFGGHRFRSSGWRTNAFVPHRSDIVLVRKMFQTGRYHARSPRTEKGWAARP